MPKSLRELEEMFLKSRIDYLGTEIGKDFFCYSVEDIGNYVSTLPYDRLPLQGSMHLSLCERCANLYIGFRCVKLIEDLPEIFEIEMREVKITGIASDIQVLGRIYLEDLKFKISEEKDWSQLPLSMRTNLVLDNEFEFFSLSVLDCPNNIKRVSLLTPNGLKSLKYLEDGIYEFDKIPFDYPDFANYINSGLLRLLFEKEVSNSKN